LRAESRIRAVVVLCCALAAGAAHAQFTQPPAVIQPSIESDVEEWIEKIVEDAHEDWVEWREALGSLDGTWEGALAVIAATEKTPAQFWRVGDQPQIQVVIERDMAVVQVKAAGDWRPLNVSGGFQARNLAPGGFVYAVQSANGWVENWNLSVTKKDADTLLVFLSFVAGGSLERIEAVDAEFAVGAMGELQRVAAVSPSGQ
jgi:hypothetical protein